MNDHPLYVYSLDKEGCSRSWDYALRIKDKYVSKRTNQYNSSKIKLDPDKNSSIVLEVSCKDRQTVAYPINHNKFTSNINYLQAIDVQFSSPRDLTSLDKLDVVVGGQSIASINQTSIDIIRSNNPQSQKIRVSQGIFDFQRPFHLYPLKYHTLEIKAHGVNTFEGNMYITLHYNHTNVTSDSVLWDSLQETWDTIKESLQYTPNIGSMSMQYFSRISQGLSDLYKDTSEDLVTQRICSEEAVKDSNTHIFKFVPKINPIGLFFSFKEDGKFVDMVDKVELVAHTICGTITDKWGLFDTNFLLKYSWKCGEMYNYTRKPIYYLPFINGSVLDLDNIEKEVEKYNYPFNFQGYCRTHDLHVVIHFKTEVTGTLYFNFIKCNYGRTFRGMYGLAYTG